MGNAENIYIGGWFQRTTLHLSEIYDFLRDTKSPLELDGQKLKKLRSALNIKTVDFAVAPFDHLILVTENRIEVKIYEDGLIVLEISGSRSLDQDIKNLSDFYEKKLSPALTYIFSLGAPVPKELANIKTIYPYFIVLKKATEKEITQLLARFNKQKYLEIRRKQFEIYRGDEFYIINNFSETAANIECFIEQQVFIREFKSQLHRYLNLHRIIWQRIAAVKEKGTIRGKEVGMLKRQIESYRETINLIEARIDQMGVYIRTREAIVRGNKNMANFLGVLDFKYETLIDTLGYIKDIWQMTKNYVNASLELFGAIQAKSTEASVKNLTVVTSMGVGATLIGLFSQKLPEFTLFGAFYFFVLVLVGYSTDKIMKVIYRYKRYQIKDTKIAKDI